MRKRILVTLLSTGAFLALATTASAQVAETIQTAPADAMIVLASTDVAENVPAGQREATPVATSTPEGISLSISGSLESNRLFQDQGLDLDTGLVGVGDLTFTHEPSGIYLDLWAARGANPDVDREEDVVVGIRRGPFDFHIGWYEVPGPEVWDFKLAVSVPLNEALSINGYAEVMRGGFSDEVAHIDLAYSHDLGNGFSFDINAGPSYSTYSRRITVGYEAGVSYEFANGVSARIFAKGYANGDESPVLFGLGFNQTFSNIFGR